MKSTFNQRNCCHLTGGQYERPCGRASGDLDGGGGQGHAQGEGDEVVVHLVEAGCHQFVTFCYNFFTRMFETRMFDTVAKTNLGVVWRWKRQD